MPVSAPHRPSIRVVAGREKRLCSGHPWLYSNEVHMDEAARSISPGSVVDIVSGQGIGLGVATFNPHCLIAGRVLTRSPEVEIDVRFFAQRLESALRLRRLLIERPFYRLVHAEADGLPGLVVDRFGDNVVIQANTAGMERALPVVVEALNQTVRPSLIVLRNDSSARSLEGLPEETRPVQGATDGPVRVEENGCVFLADLLGGQKTGWFYDQRDTRAAAAAVCGGARVADFYSYSGGFSIPCARAGAASVLLVDRSQPALELAQRAAACNGVADKCTFRRADVFTEMRALLSNDRGFDLVIADPPAFAKSRKDLAAGARAYRKLTRMAAQLVVPGGFLLICSCSHNVFPDKFRELIAKGLQDAGRSGRFVRSGGAAADHPVHPFLPESAYLKSHLIAID